MKVYETADDRMVEHEVRQSLFRITGLKVTAPRRRDYERWEGFPPFDALLWAQRDPDDFRPSEVVAAVEIKDRSNYNPILNGYEVFFCANKWHALRAVSMRWDVPAFFVVREQHEYLYFVPILGGQAARWKKRPQPRRDREEDHPVFLIPPGEFKPVEWLRQEVRDAQPF